MSLVALALVAGSTARGQQDSPGKVSFVFILIEGAIGAALVKLELVERDTSNLRALVIALHLGNTLLLMAVATLTAWWSKPGRPPGGGRPAISVWWFGLGLVAIVLTSMTGAVTALGDTVFPVGSLAEAAATDHFLVQLRIVHPVMAVATAAGLLALVGALHRKETSALARSWATKLAWAVALQVGLGFTNIALAAPTWAQLAHLLVAQGIWIAAVITIAAACSKPTTT